MAGKDSSTRQSAGAGQLERPAREHTAKRKLYVVRNENDQDNTKATWHETSRHAGSHATAQLGNLLRSIFSDVAEEPVPIGSSSCSRPSKRGRRSSEHSEHRVCACEAGRCWA
jgi:hypothetical protein